jgi:hypothetical protein
MHRLWAQGFLYPNRRNLPHRCDRVARAPPTFGILNQNAVSDQSENVAMRAVLPTLGKSGVFRSCELAFVPVQKSVDRQPLTPDERKLPPINDAPQAAKKPFHPGRDVQSPFLCLFQSVVIGVALLPDLRRYAAEPL